MTRFVSHMVKHTIRNWAIHRFWNGGCNAKLNGCRRLNTIAMALSWEEVVASGGMHLTVAAAFNFNDVSDYGKKKVGSHRLLRQSSLLRKEGLMLAEFTIYPTDETHLSKDVARVIEILEEIGVDYRLGPMGTAVDGNWDQIMSAIRRCHETIGAGCVLGRGAILRIIRTC